MVFVIHKLKYDTDNMELISERCKYAYPVHMRLFGCDINCSARNVKLWRSTKGNWLLTYETDYKIIGKAFTAEEAREILLKYDLSKYEELFGDIEEA